MVGLLSFQRVLNYGGQLQNYALYKTIAEYTDCRVIDYISEVGRGNFPIEHPKCIKELLKKIFLNKSRIIKQKKFEAFRRKNICYSQEFTRQSIQQSNDLFDTFIVGSDQTWNIDIIESDYSYYLDFVDDRNSRYAYAVSFGYENPHGDINIQKSLLSRFSRITVREETGARIVEEITGKKPEVTVDPTFLLKDSEWDIVSSRRLIDDPYVFVYIIDETVKNISTIKRYAKRNNLQIIYLTEKITVIPGMTQIRDCGPEDFISYIKHAECIFTGSFHGVCFSLIFHKKFYYTLNENGLTSRLQDILEIVDANYNVFDKCNKYSYKEIDYKKVDEIINERRRRSLEVLRSFVKE